MLPFLFSAVGEGVALLFAEEFHREHEALFNDPLERTLLESRSLWKGTAKSYPASLPPETLAKYQALPEPEKTAFRICRSLARLETEGLPENTFFLSCANLAARLGIVSMAAHRILGEFAGDGILERVEKGTRREKGKPGVATQFRFLLH